MMVKDRIYEPFLFNGECNTKMYEALYNTIEIIFIRK